MGTAPDDGDRDGYRADPAVGKPSSSPRNGHPPLLGCAPSSAGASQRSARSTRPSSTRNCALGFWRAPSRPALGASAHERRCRSSPGASSCCAAPADGPRAAAGDGGVRRRLLRSTSRCVSRVSDAGVARCCGGRRRCAGSHPHCGSTRRSVRVAVVPQLVEIDFSWNGSGIGDRSCHALAKRCGRLGRWHVQRRARERRRAARARRQVRGATLRVRGGPCSARAASSPPSEAAARLARRPLPVAERLRGVARTPRRPLRLSHRTRPLDVLAAHRRRRRRRHRRLPAAHELVAYGVPRLTRPSSRRHRCGALPAAAPSRRRRCRRRSCAALELQNCRDLGRRRSRRRWPAAPASRSSPSTARRD